MPLKEDVPVKPLTLCLFILLLVVAAPAINAQVSATAEISGTVRDGGGLVLPAVSIKLESVSTGLSRTATTNEDGFYQIVGLAPGTYRLTAERSGFKTIAQSNVELIVSQRAAVDLTLEVGEVREVVEVAAGETQLVESNKVEQSQVIGRREVESLPINGRQFIDFALLTPNISIGRSNVGISNAPQLEAQAVKISVGGLREVYSNNILIDGASARTIYTGIQRLTPSQEATSEFRVLIGTYPAEFGVSSGAVVNIVTKSGGNQFRGSVFEYFRNDALDARNSLSAPGFDVLSQNQFGFTIGGPIKQNKVFFFGNYEGQRRNESPIYSSFILNFIGPINRTRAFYGLPPESLDVIRVSNYDRGLFKTNWVNANSTYELKYELLDQRNKNQSPMTEGFGVPSTFRNTDIRDHSLVFSNIRTLSSKTVNEFLVQFASRNYDNARLNNEPSLAVSNLVFVGGTFPVPEFYSERKIQLADKLTYSTGNHTIKLGADYMHARDKTIYAGFNPAFATFTLDSFLGNAPFNSPVPVFIAFDIPTRLLGQTLPRLTNNLFPSQEFEDAATVRPNFNNFDAFVQDDYRVSSNLTLNLGLRYSFESRPLNIADNDLNNFQPRFGFAYGFNNKTVLRGGFGIYTAPMHWTDVLGIITPSGNGSGLSPVPGFNFSQTTVQNNLQGLFGPALAGPALANLLRNGTYPNFNAPGVLQFAFIQTLRDMPNPYSQQANLQFERQLGKDWSINAGWTFIHGLKNPAIREINVRPIGTLPDGRTRYALRDPRFFNFRVLEPSQSSVYHAGNLVIKKRLSHNVSLTSNYTWSKTIDSVSPSISSAQVPQDSLNTRQDRALSSMHVGHRLVFNATFDGPRQYAVTRDFRLALITTFESPRYYTLFAGLDATGDGEASPDRVGNVGRNTLRGDDYSAVDLRLSRTIRINEKYKFELSGDVFNLFNTVNVIDIGTLYGAGTLLPGQTMPQTWLDRVAAPNPTFLTPRAIANPRQIQLAIKLIF
jgi:outer membrane receptor protein involved in Fe transport